MPNIEGYLKEHRDAILADLFDFLRIPSVSTGSAHRADVARCAEFVAGQLRRAGLTRAEVRLTAGHPVVYGEWLGAPGRPTVLIYGHYDVQPPEPLDLWLSPPFEPSIRDGNVYARGATDDKGQVMVHWKAVEAALKTAGSLPVNVKFIVEGEEEAGSEHLYQFVEQNRDLLAADVVVVSDTPWFAPNLPSLTYGLRGLVYFQLDIVGPGHDLHSGQFGGSIANPVQVLCEILAHLHDREGRVTIPGFYDRVRTLTPQEREGYARLPFDEEAYRKELAVPRLWGEAGYTTLERLWARPTLEINGIWGGYAGEGSKTVLPSRAGAKVSCRLVPDQDPDEIQAQVEQCVRSLCPPTVELQMTFLHCGKPYLMTLEHPALQAAARALKTAFGREPVFTREGGSIPVVATFAEQLHAPTILMGFGLPDENCHAPNEHFRLDNFWGGIRASVELWDQLAHAC